MAIGTPSATLAQGLYFQGPGVEFGIGRPSTYASTLEVLRVRSYVRMEQKRFFPEDKGLTLQVQAADEATVYGDRDLLFEAVANLVDNAVKFTPEGGQVELALLRREGEPVIRVSDTGPGIPESEREAVTRRFYRSDKSRRTEGLGLGLSLVAAIVKLHGFRFTIAAGPGCTAEIACKLVR